MKALASLPFHSSLPECPDLRWQQGWVQVLTPEPQSLLSRWLAWGILEGGNLQVGWEPSLCQGLIQGSGIKPLAWGLNWNFIGTDASGTRRWAGSGTVCAVGSEKVLNAIMGIKVKKEMRGPGFLLSASIFEKIFLLNLRWEQTLETTKEHEGIYSQGQEWLNCWVLNSQ